MFCSVGICFPVFVLIFFDMLLDLALSGVLASCFCFYCFPFTHFGGLISESRVFVVRTVSFFF